LSVCQDSLSLREATASHPTSFNTQECSTRLRIGFFETLDQQEGAEQS
jgi:hypothetical protein